jgi:hypothetical protein
LQERIDGMSSRWTAPLGAAIAGVSILIGAAGIAWGQQAGETATSQATPQIEAPATQVDVPATQPVPESSVAVSTQPAPAAKDWVDQVKHPVSWFAWGFDERLRQEYFNNVFNLENKRPNREWNFGRYRSRLWTTLTPCDQFEANIRVAWESRYWFQPGDIPARDDYVANNMFFDNLNFKIKQPFGLPVTTTVGRQDILLGDGWLVADGTPYDGSTSVFFDAIRTTVDMKEIKTTADIIYIQNYATYNKWLPPEDTRHAAQQIAQGNSSSEVIEQDEKGAILWLANKSIKATEIDGYFIYKHSDAVFASADDGDIYTLGSRAVHNFGEHWLAKAEGAMQFGNQKTLYPKFSPAFGQQQKIWAGGATTSLTYLFNDKWNNQLATGYEFLSGDRAGSNGTNEAFNSVWGRWPQWSELMVYNFATEERIAQITNLHRIWYGWQADPTKKIQLQARYHLLFSDRNTFEESSPANFGSGCFRGQVVTGLVRYKINRFLSGHVVAEWFQPGDYYSAARDDSAFFTRAELVFSF